MHLTPLTRGGWVRAACALLILLLLAACGPSANTTPTVSVQAVYTAAFQTLAAQQATLMASTPPTSTPEPPTLAPPTLALSTQPGLPTLAFASPTARLTGGGSSGACDSAAFVSDVTIPDNTSIQPGKTFTKTWALMNNGTCTWDTTYKIAFQGGDQMGGNTTPLTASVPPGSTVNVSVKMTAPTSNGTYKGTWQMQNGANQFFGVAPYVIIKVGGGPTATAGPSPTAAAACTTTCTITLSSDRPDFVVTITKNKGGNTECVVPTDGKSCSFTVPAHWDGTVTISKGKYSFDNNPYTFTNVTHDMSVFFQSH